MQVFLGVINVLLIINALVLIVSVLMQEGSRQGLGAIAGGAETFFGKSKAKGYEAKLEWITKIGVTTFIIFAILMTAINARKGISNVSPGVDLSNAPTVEKILDEKKIITGEGLDTTLPELADEAALTDDAAVPSAEETAPEVPVAEDTESPVLAETPVTEGAPVADEVPAA